MKLGAQAAPPAADTGLNVAERLGLRRGRRGPSLRDLAGRRGLPARPERRRTLTKTSIGDFNAARRRGRAAPGDSEPAVHRREAGTRDACARRRGQRVPRPDRSMVAATAASRGCWRSPWRRTTRHQRSGVRLLHDNGGDLQLDEYSDGVRTPVLRSSTTRPTTTTAASSCSGRTERSTSPPATAAPRAIPRATLRTRTRCSGRS